MEKRETEVAVEGPPAPAGARRSDRRMDVLLRLARERLPTDPKEAARLALSAVELGRADSDRLGTARAMLTLSEASLASGTEPAQVFAPIRIAIAELADLGDLGSEGAAHLVLANLYFEEAALEDAALAARQSKRLARLMCDPHLEARAELRLATIFGEFPGESQIDKVRQRFNEVAKAFLSMGDEQMAAVATLNLAIGELGTKNYEAAFELAGRALDLNPRSAVRPSVYALRAIASARLGWDSVARFELAEAEMLATAGPNAAKVAVEILYARAVVHMSAGRHAEAEHDFRTAIDRAHQLRDPYRMAMYLGELSELCELAGNLPGALSASRAQHQSHLNGLMADRARRFRAVEMAGRLEDERRRSEQLVVSQAKLEVTVARAKDELLEAERQLELERSRRSLVELRSGHVAGVEPLTGLPDLTAIAGRINSFLDAYAPIAVVVITIDEDRVAAPLPDARQRLVQEVAARTHSFLQHIDGAVAGSLGSEDLVVVLPMTGAAQEVLADLARLHASLASPLELLERHVSISVQLGVALAPEHGNRPNRLLSRARLAAQASRQARPQGPVVAVFSPEVEERQHLRNYVRENLPHAMSNDRITVMYQPIIDCETGRPSAAEALVRWNDPTRGYISPADFIPMAEETGQIVELGGYVLKQACCEAASWKGVVPGLRPPVVAVNVSASQLNDGILLAQVDAALLVSGLAPDRLALELTETALANGGDGIAVLNALRARGITVKIDDFGTGYSSFSYLTRFPVDCVKIDKSFVDRVTHSDDDAAITAAIIAMAHALRLEVVAEGVESSDQADILVAQGCDSLQGYLFSRPMQADAFREWLGNRQPVHSR
jgi:predicted signal transduction protein with EAL and GGDEF domain